MKQRAYVDGDGGDGPLEVLWEDAERVFCRQWRNDVKSHRFAFMPVLTGVEPSTLEGIDRLTHEYELRDRLDAAWALRPVEVVRERGRTMLVVEYAGGEPLERMVGQPMETGLFLRSALALTSALSRMHGRGLIHQDIKPSNVLVEPNAGSVWLTGFGIAAPLPRERQSTEAPGQMSGTLAYMAPEQTGRLKCSVDARSDLYSLGVTLYQMVTGALPFAATDPMQLVHCHIARQPVPPIERAPRVPAALSAVIMKLLAKSPEDRYQTAAGVDADLRRCLGPYQLALGIEPFALAAHDIPDVLRIPEKLYGREQSIQALLAALERVTTDGSSELMLIAGYSGIGKSSVVHELQTALSTSQRIFAAGKCDQLKREIPYGTLAQALQALVQMVLRSSDAELESWREIIQRAVEPNGQLITSLLPELELVIGMQSAVPDLPPQDSRNRFQMVFRDFLQVFARPKQPLVLFLDDLHWIDSATLALVEDLLGRHDTRHLLLIGAYRDNEVGTAHPLVLAVDALRRTGTRVNEIVLAALELAELDQLVASALHCDASRARPLAGLVADKTGGNPFFAIQFLTELAAEGLLSFDPGIGAWTWDVERIVAKGYTDNIVQLMVVKLKRLAPPAQQGLQELACLGNIADFATLAIVRGSSEEELHLAFRDATNAGLVIRLASAYRFAHDRVQEAAYALIPQGRRPERHLRIGRQLHAALEPTAERVFAVVNQLNHAVALISDAEERWGLLTLNVLAGIKAKAGIAHGAARDYFAHAAALVAADAWIRDYDATLELHLGLAECEYLVGNFGSADGLFALMLGHARSDLDRARIYRLHMKVCQVGGGYDESLALALEALKLFGVTFPESDAELQPIADAELLAVTVNLGERRIADLLDAPTAADPKVWAVIGLLVDAVPSAYNGRPKLVPVVCAKAVSFSLRCGNTDQSSYAYATHAMTLVSAHGELAQAFEFSEMALRLNEKFNNARLRGPLLHVHGDHINFWRRPFATGVPLLEQGFQACLEVGELVNAGHIAFLRLWLAIEKGDTLDEACTLAARSANFARQSHNDAVYHTIELERQFICSLQGRTSDPLKLDEAGFDEGASLAAIAKAAFGCGLVFHQIMKQILAFLHGRFAEALEAARLAESMLGAALALPIEATHHFYHALTLTALYPEAAQDEQAQMAEVLEGKLKKLKLWSDNCPQNYENRYKLVLAEIARIEHRPAEAMDLYELAIRSARDNGFLQNEALAFELAARFYATRGFVTFSDTYLKSARDGYARWGAEGKIRQLAEVYPQLSREAARPRGRTRRRRSRRRSSI
jgi:predicted ATPase